MHTCSSISSAQALSHTVLCATPVAPQCAAPVATPFSAPQTRYYCQANVPKAHVPLRQSAQKVHKSIEHNKHEGFSAKGGIPLCSSCQGHVTHSIFITSQSN
eukprot:4059128-Ditylum_brightwellii.AAC.1